MSREAAAIYAAMQEEYELLSGCVPDPASDFSLRFHTLAAELAELEARGEALERQIKEKEGQRLLARIKDGDFVIALAIEGRMLSSEELAARLERLGVDGVSHIVFVIGGSLGLSEAVLRRADFSLSFSRMTFPHQLMRVVLLEQIYRSFRINAGEPYHK